MLFICRVIWAVFAEQAVSFDAAGEWGLFGRDICSGRNVPSLLAQGEGLDKGKGAVCLLGVVFTLGKQNPVSEFVSVNCLVMLVELLGLLLGSPGVLLEVYRKPSSRKKIMRQWIFNLTLCQEVGRPHRKCFCKQGTPSSYIAGTLCLYNWEQFPAIFISVFSQSALYG